MKILIVSQYFWPENFRVTDLAVALQGRGHKVTVLTGKPNYPSGEFFPEFIEDPKKFAHFQDIDIIRVPMAPRHTGSVRLFINYVSFVLGASLWGPARLKQHDFDAIFVFGPSPITAALPAILLGKLKNTPVLFWVLDLWPETLKAVNAVRSPFILRLVGYLASFIYNHCTLVLGQSHAFLKNIQKYCNDERKIKYFPSWAESLPDATQIKAAPEIPPEDGSFDIIFSGNIGEAQDMPALLGAAELLKNDPKIRWIIIGDGRKSSWLAEEVSKRGLEKSVFLLGRFPIERMPSFYVHADALLVCLKNSPVFAMTIPGKLQSYLSANRPLLGMLDGEGASIINEAKCGLACAAGDSEGLAQAVKKLKSLPQSKRVEMGENGLAYMRREFDRDILITRLENYMELAIARNRSE